jgi:hypothetical protein
MSTILRYREDGAAREEWGAQRRWSFGAGVAMPDFNEQPDSDAEFRHHSAFESSGRVSAETTPASGQNIGATAWADPGASAVVKGERAAGGADGNHPHLFHLAEGKQMVNILR